VAEIAPGDGVLLVRLARAALEAAVERRPPPLPPDTPVCARRSGAFVSLHRHGDLRGCIGQPEPTALLGAVIVHCAVAAALEDPRFPQVIPDELPSIDVEVSVLTTPVAVADPSTIDVGRHGLIIARAGRRGLLLPQVAVEFGWSREEFLAHTCRKAGLEPDAWRHGAELLSFEAEIFGEDRRHD
jgi:AmmeMemoRadiSam system protein A